MKETSNENFNDENACKSAKIPNEKKKHQIKNHPLSPQNDKENKNKKYIILFILLLLIVFIILFFSLFFTLKKKNKNIDNNDNNINNNGINHNDKQKNDNTNDIIENDKINNNDDIKCEIENCLICDINKECINCNQGYDLVNKKCIKYSFKAVYKSDFDNENIKLIDTLPTDIIEMTVDGIKVEPSKNYTFLLSGNHIVHILIDITNCTSLNFMFIGITKMISITFSQYFNTQNIKEMCSTFFGCSLLTSIDFSILNTQNLKDVEALFDSCFSLVKADFSNLDLKSLEKTYKMFYLCPSLTDINFSNVKTLNLTDMEGMFGGCTSLTSIDLSSFESLNVINLGLIFDDCPNLIYVDISSFICKTDNFYGQNPYFPDFGTIKISIGCINQTKEYFPPNWSIIIQ